MFLNQLYFHNIINFMTLIHSRYEYIPEGSHSQQKAYYRPSLWEINIQYMLKETIC